MIPGVPGGGWLPGSCSLSPPGKEAARYLFIVFLHRYLSLQSSPHPSGTYRPWAFLPVLRRHSGCLPAGRTERLGAAEAGGCWGRGRLRAGAPLVPTPRELTPCHAPCLINCPTARRLHLGWGKAGDKRLLGGDCPAGLAATLRGLGRAEGKQLRHLSCPGAHPPAPDRFPRRGGEAARAA